MVEWVGVWWVRDVTGSCAKVGPVKNRGVGELVGVQGVVWVIGVRGVGEGACVDRVFGAGVPRK